MPRAPQWPVAVAALGALAWFAFVLWRYQAVTPLLPTANVLATLAFLAAFSCACLGAGWPLWRWAGGGRALDAAALTVAFAAGAGVLAAGAGIASLLGVLRPPVLLAIGGVAAAGGIVVLARTSAPRPRLAAGLLVPAALVALAAVITIPVLGVLSPFYDQFNYHLAFPFQWLRHGHVFVFPRHSYSYLTANMGLLYCYGMAGAGAWTGQAIYCWTGAVAALGSGALATRLAGPRAGWWAAAIFVATPSVLLPATWASSDLGVAAFAVAAWLVTLRALDEERTAFPARLWLLAGVLAGLAAGCKYLALAMVAAPLFLVVVAARRAASPGERGRRALLWLAGAALVFSPWCVRNLVVTGNPLFPFFNSLMPPRTLERAQGPAQVAAAATVAQFPASRLAPSDRLTLGSFRPQGAAGAIGPVVLALVPLGAWAALRRRRRGGAVLAAGVVLGVAGWWYAPQLGRYLAPVVALMAALHATGWTIARRRLGRAARAGAPLLLAGALVWNLTTVLAENLDRFAIVLGRSGEDEMLRAQVTYWEALDVVNRELPETAKVLLVAEARTLGFEREVLVEDPFRPPLLLELAERCATPAEMSERLAALGVTHVLFNQEEARRIAEMTHRRAYFATDDPEAAQRLNDFFKRCVRPLATAGATTVMVLLPAA